MKPHFCSDIAFTAPHHLATEAGMNILREGGSAVEAMVTAAAVITVVYPHMNSIGGDSFWLIDDADKNTPIAIDACGRSASHIPDEVLAQEHLALRGGASCLTQAGTLRGWQRALSLDSTARLPLSRLLQPAIDIATRGFEVSHSLQLASEKLFQVEQRNTEFKAIYEPNGRPLKQGELFRNPVLAQTFQTLADKGLDDFYIGSIAQKIAETLKREGSLVTESDHASTTSLQTQPLQTSIEGATLYNLPAPTQGISSMMILAIADRLKQHIHTEADLLHILVEATKFSFDWRNKNLTDPGFMAADYSEILESDFCQTAAAAIDLDHARPWPFAGKHGDTVWMGARDSRGQLVSFIQSVYWEFGSGVAIEGGGFVWNNRGVSFNLNNDSPNQLAPNKKPFHTLNPAMARFHNGRRMSYGTMGGEGQPQTQAALFARHVWQGLPIDEAIAKGRWLLGRTWGDQSDNLKVEADLRDSVAEELDRRRHDWCTVDACNELMGHAGAIVELEGSDTAAARTLQTAAATDPRSDGKAISEPFTTP